MRNDPTTTGPEPATVSLLENRGCGKLFFFVFFGLFFVVGSILFVCFCGLPLYRVQASRDWPQVPCTILESKVGSHRGDDGTTYSIDITFQYDYLDQTYKSERYSFLSASSSGYARKAEVVRQYPVGSQHRCYVNPNDPQMAVLHRRATTGMYLGLLTLIFVLVGAGGIVGTLLYKPKPPGETTWMPDVTSHGTVTDEGTVVLKPENRPLTQFLVLAGVSLFWCGIVAIATYQEVDAFRRGNPEWILTLFLIPFQLIGMLLVTLTAHSFLSIFNPVPVLEVNSTQLALGDTLEVAWRFEGRTSAIRQLTITVTGTEKAEYRRGTTTHTDESIFFKEAMVETRLPLEISGGEATFEIPVTTMHSFRASHNQIVWQLKVHGEIRLWPDVDASFPIVVNPVFLS